MNTAADVQGRSDATTTKSSVSSRMPTLATWAAKPRGNSMGDGMLIAASVDDRRVRSQVGRGRTGRSGARRAASVPWAPWPSSEEEAGWARGRAR